MTLDETYVLFQREYPDAKLGFVRFTERKTLDKRWMVNGHDIFGIPGTTKANCFRSQKPGVAKFQKPLKLRVDSFLMLLLVKNGMTRSKMKQSAVLQLRLLSGQWVKVLYEGNEYHHTIIDSAENEYRCYCCVLRHFLTS